MVPDWLRWRSEASPDAMAVRMGKLEWSYSELQLARQRSLASPATPRCDEGRQGGAPHARPSLSFVALVHAVARIGAVAVPLNHGQSVPELASQMLDSDPSLVVYDAALMSVAKRLETEGRPGARGKKGTAARRWEAISDLMAATASSSRGLAGDHLDLLSPHAIVYTSGSSGEPKGVVLTLSNLMWNALSVGLRVGATPDDKWLLCMPLFHVGGYSIIFRSLLYGNGVVLQPSFDPIRVSRSLDEDGITLVSFVPTMLSELLDARRTNPLSPRVRAIFLGGGQPPTQLLSAIKRRRLPVLLTYGMTETCSQVAVADVADQPEPFTYRPLLPTSLAVMKLGTKNRVAFAKHGEVGEVAVRGPTVFSGYWRKPKLTGAKFSEGWFLTGDLGVAAEDTKSPEAAGLTILGRKEETIVSGGEKILPAEVESALREHSAVRDAVVIGLADARWGERVVAVIETRPGYGDRLPSAKELSVFLKEKVARYKVPKQYHFWTELPRTPTGKTRRAAVRQRLERGEGST